MMKDRIRYVIEGLIAGTAFGTASIIIRLLENVNVYTIASMRLIIAFLALIVICFFAKGTLFRLRLFDPHLVAMGLLIGLHFLFFISAVKNTTIVNATVLVNTAPVLTLLLGILVFDVRVSIRDVLCVFIAFLGAFIITYPDLRVAGNLWGDIEAIIAALFEGLYLNIGFKVRRKMDAMLMMIPIYLFATIVVSLSAYLTGNPLYFPLEIRTITLLIAIGLIPTAIGHTLYVSSLRGLKSFETAMMALLEPLSASIIAFFLFSEVPDLWSITGSIIVMFAVVLVSTKKENTVESM